MAPTASIAHVASRIADIRARVDTQAGLGSASHPLMQAGAPIEAPVPVDFEPFGEVYQEALTAVSARAAEGEDLEWQAWSDRAMVQSMSPMSGYGLAGALPGTTGLSGTGFPSAATHGGGCTHCAAISSVGPVGPTVDPRAVPTGQSVGKIGGYGRLGPPAELVAYGNGRIPPHALDTIGQGGHRLYAPAAAAWRALVDEAASHGIEMRITDSYRSYDQQVDLVRRKGLYSEGGLGATPGTSNHGWGLAVDANVNDPRALDWMRTNAWRFGFVEAVPREPWHWEFRPHQA